MKDRDILTEISNLKLENSFYKRQLDINYKNIKKRQEIFEKINKNDEKLKILFFKLNVLRKRKEVKK